MILYFFSCKILNLTKGFASTLLTMQHKQRGDFMKKVTIFFLLTSFTSITHLPAMQPAQAASSFICNQCKGTHPHAVIIRVKTLRDLEQLTSELIIHFRLMENDSSFEVLLKTQPSPSLPEIISRHKPPLQTHEYCLQEWIIGQYGTARHEPRPMKIVPEADTEPAIPDNAMVDTEATPPHQSLFQGPLPHREAKSFLAELARAAAAEGLAASLHRKTQSYQTTKKQKK